jgi:hypothetical protein
LTGGSERIAIFVDQATREVVRLRPGAGYMGWNLDSVNRSTATLKKSADTETLEFPKTVPPSAPATFGSTGAPPRVASERFRPGWGGPRIAIPGGGTAMPLRGAKAVPVTIPAASSSGYSRQN